MVDWICPYGRISGIIEHCKCMIRVKLGSTIVLLIYAAGTRVKEAILWAYAARFGAYAVWAKYIFVILLFN